VLFLGILDPKKGLPRLLDAWHALGAATAGWSLAIAGGGSTLYRAGLESQARRLGVAAQFLGPVWTDAQRASLYASADVFVLPTDWENFGIVVAEALAARVPVITTTGAPWRELQTERCGWWIEPTVSALTAALREAFALSQDERDAMGERGRALVETRYAWPAIGRQMAAVYRWVAGRGARPACVTDD
jgi:glycosyltransferase involved in cell wall biosynthesis